MSFLSDFARNYRERVIEETRVVLEHIERLMQERPLQDNDPDVRAILNRYNVNSAQALREKLERIRKIGFQQVRRISLDD